MAQPPKKRGSLPPLAKGTPDVPAQPELPVAKASGREAIDAEEAPASARGPPELDSDAELSDAQQRCFDYVFVQKVVPRALIRAIVYAKYGPGERQEDGSVRLRGARKILLPFEEHQLLVDERDRFVTDIYGGSLSSQALAGTDTPVDNESYGAMNRTKNRLALDAMEMSRYELKRVLASADRLFAANSDQQSLDGSALAKTAVARAKAKGLSAPSDLFAPQLAMSVAYQTSGKKFDGRRAAITDAISTAVLVERRRRIAALKCSEPSRESVRTDTDVTQRQTRHFYNRSAPKPYRLRTFEDPRDVLRSLHRQSHGIMDPANWKDTSVTLNVRCLRSEFEPDETKQGWDGYCCRRNTNPSKATTLR